MTRCFADQSAKPVEATTNNGSRARHVASWRLFERARWPDAVLSRRPRWGWRTSTKTAGSGLLRTHSPMPSAIGVDDGAQAMGDDQTGDTESVEALGRLARRLPVETLVLLASYSVFLDWRKGPPCVE